MIHNSLSFSSLLQIAEMKNFVSLKEMYLFLKEQASLTVINILDDSPRLRENLIERYTYYSAYHYIEGTQIVDQKDKMDTKVFSLARSEFDIGSSFGTLSLNVNLGNYLYQKIDTSYRDFVVYIMFRYCPDLLTYLYCEEISGDEHLILNIPDKVLYRHLPLLYQMTDRETCMCYLNQAYENPLGLNDVETISID